MGRIPSRRKHCPPQSPVGQEEVYLPASVLNDVLSLLPAERDSVIPALVHGHPEAGSWPLAQFTPVGQGVPHRDRASGWLASCSPPGCPSRTTWARSASVAVTRVVLCGPWSLSPAGYSHLSHLGKALNFLERLLVVLLILPLKLLRFCKTRLFSEAQCSVWSETLGATCS